MTVSVWSIAAAIAVLLAIGLFLFFFGKVPGLGKLPGDIVIDRGNFKMYLPITTSILASVVISLVLFFIHKARQ